MNIEIKNRAGVIILAGDYESVKQACEQNKLNLAGAYLENANLQYASLRGAELKNASLRGAELKNAKGVVQFGPCPGSGRIGLAVLHSDCVMVQLGCFWGTAEKAIEAVAAQYADRTAERDDYTGLIKAAVAALNLQRVVKGGRES